MTPTQPKAPAPLTGPLQQSGAVPADLIAVDPGTDEVCCDGGDGALGHPQVWYSFDGGPTATCRYCDRVFVKSPV